MQRLILFIGLFCFLNSYAQSVSKVCDTCIATQAKQLQDSLQNALLNKGSVLKDSSLKSGKDVLKTKINQGYDATISKTDSTSRSGFHKKAINSAKGPIIQTKDISASKWNGIKSKLPKGKQLFNISGQVRSESFVTSAQNPIIRSEMVYSRLYISPTITLLGLPFTSNFFFTTEANNTYKNNFFSIRFDAAAMRRNAINQIQKELDDAKKLDRIRQVDLQKYKFENSRYEEEMKQLEKQIPDLKTWQENLKTEAENKAKQKLEEEQLALEEKIKTLPEEEKKRLQEKFKQKQDSLTQEFQKNAEDSVLNTKSSMASSIDSAKINRYLRLKSKVEGIKAKQKELQELRQLDSAALLEKTQGIRDPDDLKEMAKNRLPGKKLLQSIISIDRFGIGLVNPQYSEFTLMNATVKGIDVGINKQKYFYDLSLGKTTRQFFSPFSNTLPEYNRYLGVARIGLGELKGDYLAMEYLYAFDKEIIDPLQALVKNGVINVSGHVTWFKQLSIEASAAQSFYRESFMDREQTIMKPVTEKSLGIEANRAYQIKATQTFKQNIKLEASLKQTGAGFRTVGNPFLRRNFREAEFKYEQQFFKKKLRVSAFYKEMRDNLIEINLATNRLKGYGLKASTAFEKLPNLTMSYSPYQQGNNHPDSLYRSNNQYSITTAMLTYKKRWKLVQWSTLFNYTRSAMEIGQRGTVSYRMLNAVQNIQIGQRHHILINCMNNITGPSVDSLNSSSIQTAYNYQANKKLSTGILTEYTRYQNMAFRAGAGLQLSVALFKNFNLSLLCRYDKINGLWNLENADVYSGRVVAVWRW